MLPRWATGWSWVSRPTPSTSARRAGSRSSARPSAWPSSSALKVVDEVFVEESLEQKRDYLLEHGADVLVMGDDWAGRFDDLSDICEVVYLPRTPAISTTAIIEHIADL